MSLTSILLILLGIALLGSFYAKSHVLKMAGSQVTAMHSLPNHHFAYTFLVTLLPAAIVAIIWSLSEQTVIMNLVVGTFPENIQALPADLMSLTMTKFQNFLNGVVFGEPDPWMVASGEAYVSMVSNSRWGATLVSLILAGLGTYWAVSRIEPQFRARNRVETIIKGFLIVCSIVAILTTIGIVVSVLFESIRFFREISIFEFLFGTHWSPMIAMREDQAGSSGSFGAIPLFAGTLLISAIAMSVAIPVGLMSAIYLSEYANQKARSVLKPLLEILAGIPTVVYGFFAALTVAPFLAQNGASLGLDVSTESALAAGIVMGIMIIPFISSLSDDVINSVPQSLRDAAYGLGATRSETIRQVILPAALPGIVGAVLLAVSRAIGETMIVVMAAGVAARLTANPLESVTTVTVQIVKLLIGDQEFDSPKTMAAFALGLTLLVITLCLNIYALHVVRKYREQYD